MLEADEIIQNSKGFLNIKFNEFDIEKIESDMNIIAQYMRELSLKECDIFVYWK